MGASQIMLFMQLKQTFTNILLQFKDGLTIHTRRQALLFGGAVCGTVVLVFALCLIMKLQSIELAMDMEVERGDYVLVYLNKNYYHADKLPLQEKLISVNYIFLPHVLILLHGFCRTKSVTKL